MPNVYRPHFDEDQEGRRRADLARAAGAEQLGASLYELDPGASLRLESADEAIIVVLDGQPTLVGEAELSNGAIVARLPDQPGVQLENRSDAPARVLIVTTPS